jgi:hypothetical protein
MAGAPANGVTLRQVLSVSTFILPVRDQAIRCDDSSAGAEGVGDNGLPRERGGGDP